MFLMMQTHGPCGLQVPRAATSRSRMRAGRKQGPEQPAREAGPTGSLCPLGLAGWPAHLLPLSLAEEPTFRCDVCDELFQSKLDLRRHKKYTCSSVGAVLYEGLGAELKAEGLGRGSSDGQAHECKDCERMFPNKYRCVPPQWVLRISTGAPQQMPPSSTGVPPPHRCSPTVQVPPRPPVDAPQHPHSQSGTAGSFGPGSTEGALRRAEVSPCPSALSTMRQGFPPVWHILGVDTPPAHPALGTEQAMSWWLEATGAPSSDRAGWTLVKPPALEDP